MTRQPVTFLYIYSPESYFLRPVTWSSPYHKPDALCSLVPQRVGSERHFRNHARYPSVTLFLQLRHLHPVCLLVPLLARSKIRAKRQENNCSHTVNILQESARPTVGNA